MRETKILLIFICVLIIVGCNSEDVDTEGSNTKKEIKAEIPEKVEDMIAQGPGKYAGDNYDEEKVKAELDKIDANASKEEVYATVMSLLAEDYPSILKALDEIDTSFAVDSKTPGTDVDKPTLPQYNISILLDASGSMAAQVSGGRKMNVAKEAVETFASTFPEEANVSLIAYGHKGSNSEKDKGISCSEIEEIYPLTTYDESSFSQALKEVDATGWTPLADAIKKAGETLKANADENSKNIVYVVSDGLETCGGDPAKEAKALQEDGISATVNIIGFDVENEEQQALKEAAEAGGGTFTAADSKSELESYFRGQYNKLIGEWWSYQTISGTEIAKQRDQRNRELWEIRDGEYIEKRDRERENVGKAIDYLEQQKKGESIKADYNNRAEKIHKYFWSMFGDLYKEIYNNSMELNEKIDNNAQKKRDELEKRKESDTND